MNVNKLIDFYNQGNSLKKTSIVFKISLPKLKKILKENKIYLRTQKEQLIIENIKRTKNINHYYFDNLNEINCYYLGFLYADGTVRKDRNEIKISLSSIDLNFLKEFKKNLNIENEIHIRQTAKGFEVCELTLSSLKIKQDIAKYGIVPNKTYIESSLSVIPTEFRLAFIKGYFDGDGSFSFNKNTRQCKITFTSYTKKMLEDIKNYFGNGNIYQDKRNKIYSLEISTLPSLNIMKNFYEINTPYLCRKKEKYLEALKLRK